jgi:hypothetical protein
MSTKFHERGWVELIKKQNISKTTGHIFQERYFSFLAPKARGGLVRLDPVQNYSHLIKKRGNKLNCSLQFWNELFFMEVGLIKKGDRINGEHVNSLAKLFLSSSLFLFLLLVLFHLPLLVEDLL